MANDVCSRAGAINFLVQALQEWLFAVGDIGSGSRMARYFHLLPQPVPWDINTRPSEEHHDCSPVPYADGIDCLKLADVITHSGALAAGRMDTTRIRML